jgi:hypothetical protein
MKSTLFAIPVTILAIVTLIAAPAHAQAAKKARGKVTTITATNLALDVAGTPMNFAVDAKTRVEAPGGSTATRKAAAAGKAGVPITDVIKTGDAVEVSYADMGGKMQASMIRKVTSVGAATTTGGSSTTTAGAAKSTTHAIGKVTAVSATSLTITETGKAAQTFAIDAKTRVIGRGVGTMASKTAGKISATDAIGSGDTVNVSFTSMNGTMHADQIRVTAKAAK